AISPGMVGAALDQHITGNQLGFTDIHDRPNLTGEHDRVVDGAGAMHVRVPYRAALARRFGRLVDRNRSAHGGSFGRPVLVRWKLHHTEDTAGVWRRHLDRELTGVLLGFVAIVGRRGKRLPEIRHRKIW